MSELSAGRELDARVAVEVMGWTEFPYMMHEEAYTIERRYADKIIGHFAYCEPGVRSHVSSIRRVPHYSSEIAAAWLVVEKLREQYDISLAVEDSGSSCILFAKGTQYVVWFEQDAATMPLAICLASLTALAAVAAQGERP